MRPAKLSIVFAALALFVGTPAVEHDVVAQGFGLGWSASYVAQQLETPVNTVIPVVTGMPLESQTLTVSAGTWSGSPSISYQWYDQTLGTVNGLPTNTILTPIAGATSSSYTVQASDVGAWLLPVVTGVNGAGSNTSIPVYPVGTVPAAQSAAPANTTAPTIGNVSGLVGGTLTVSSGAWTNSPVTYNYQWCSDNTTAYPTSGVCPSGYGAIPSAIAKTYVIQVADMGTTPSGTGHIVGEVQAVNSYCGPTVSTCPWQEAFNSATGVAEVIDYATITPSAGSSPITVTGTPGVGNTISLSQAQNQPCNNSSSTYDAWTNPGTVNAIGTCVYQWQDCNGTSCTNIPAISETVPCSLCGGTGQSYTINKTDIGYAIRFEVTGCNNAGCGTQCSDFASGNIPCSTIPSTPAVPAEPSSAPTITVPVVSVVANCSSSTVESSPVVGYCLKAAPGSSPTNSPLAYTWQWFHGASGSGTPITGATAYDYALTAADVGQSLYVQAIGLNDAGAGAAVDSTASAAVTESPPVNSAIPVVTGVPVQGGYLQVSTGSWTNSPTTYAAQWCSSGVANSGVCPTGYGPITGATNSYYSPQSSDDGYKLLGVVTASNNASYGGGSATADSAATAAVTNPGGLPANTVAPSISGTDNVGATLTANVGTWSPAATGYVYQWTLSGVLVGTSATYTPTATGSVGLSVAATNAVGTAPPVAATGVTITLPATPTATQIPGWGLASADIVSAGTDYATNFNGASGTYTTVSGGSCTTEPSVGLYIDSNSGDAGPITTAYVSTLGSGCLTSPTVALARYGSGTGASITVALNDLPYVNQPISWSNGVWTPTTSTITYSYGVCSIATSATFDTSCSQGVLQTSAAASYVPRSYDLGNNLYFLVYATNAGGTTVSYIEGAAPVAESPIASILPTSADVYQPPTIVGAAAVGNDLVASLGSWTVGGSGTVSTVFYPTGNSQVYPLAPAFSFQWYQGSPGSGTAINCTTYPDACRQMYTLQPSDQGHTIYVGVKANTSGGNSSEVDSAATSAVAAFPYTSGACEGWASSTYWDGCANAPTTSAGLGPYQVQHSNFFSGYAPQIGQSYVSTNGCKGNANCHPPQAVAGVDYPVGVSTTGSCPSPTATNGCFAQPGGNTDPTNFASPNYNGNPAECYQPTVTSTGWTAAWASGTLTLTAGASTYVGGKVVLSGFVPSSLNGTYTGVLGDQVLKGGTFTLPVTSSPGAISTGATFTGSISGTTLTVTGSVTGTIAVGQTLTGTGVDAGQTIISGSGTSWVVSTSQTVAAEALTASASVFAYENGISCPGPTNQAVDIGPFDFSNQGNIGGSALSLEIGAGVTGPCIIHDNYMPIDLNSTHMPNDAEVSIMTGCSSLVFVNNKMNIRDPLNPTNTYPFWYGQDNANLVWMALAAGESNSEQANRPVIAEYNAFASCNARCFAANDFDIRHNYYEGININAPGASAAHGDGIIASGYNGPTTLESSQQCNCSGFNQAVERGDTWLVPAYGAGTTTCLTCVAINVPAFSMYGWSSGDDILHVTSMSSTSPNWPDIGAAIGSGLASFTEPFPAIAECQTAAGVVGCSLGQAQSCSPAAPCLYTMTSAMQPCFDTQASCAYNFNFPADWDDVEYTNNVYATNLVNATGSGEEAAGGPGGGGASAITYMSYGRISNGAFSNNYIDPCGATTNGVNTGWPNYQCPSTLFPAIPSFGATGNANLSAIGVNNVVMTNGQCALVFGETSPPTDCLP